jgi:predicted porin
VVKVSIKGFTAGIKAMAAVSLVITFAPAQGSSVSKANKAIIKQALGQTYYNGIGSFTPAAADPRLAAAFAHTGIMNTGFRFTPAGASAHIGRGITVAVRARSTASSQDGVVRLVQLNTNLTPTAYNLGLAVGWRKFALTTDYTHADFGLLQGARDEASIGLSYNARKWSSRLAIATEKPSSAAPQLGLTESTSVDVGSSYRLTHNFDVTAGVRYKREHELLDQLSDTRRDSQAVYVGTQFRF